MLHDEARYYDLLAGLLTLGRERAFRERIVELAEVRPGDRVLDVGCGTGTLAIAMKRRVGRSGVVCGIDASPEMIARARRKAAKARVDVSFDVAIVEALPFGDASFDVVTSTLMLHHLPMPVRQQCVREIRRVLKPGGRLLTADFARPKRRRRGPLLRLHRHGHFALADMVKLLDDAGLHVEEVGAVGLSEVQFARGRAPLAGDSRAVSRAAPTVRSLPPLRLSPWLLAPIAIVAIVGHAAILRYGWTALPPLAVLLVAVFAAVAHVGAGLTFRRAQSAGDRSR